jgi:hypothetical protein
MEEVDSMAGCMVTSWDATMENITMAMNADLDVV